MIERVPGLAPGARIAPPPTVIVLAAPTFTVPPPFKVWPVARAQPFCEVVSSVAPDWIVRVVEFIIQCKFGIIIIGRFIYYR